MNSLLSSLSAQDFRRAAEIKEKIDSLQNELAKILGTESVTTNRQARPGKRKMSAAAKARIAAGARARWARVKGAESPEPVKKIRKKRSAAARARLSAIAKERWRKVKAAGKTTL
jgi:hypothetical protein